MAQYQKQFYSSSLYGHINAFYGEYITEVFDGQEPFTSVISATIQALLPSTTYSATESEFTVTNPSNWTVQGTELKTRVANSPIEFIATGDNIEIQVRLQNQGSQTIEAKLFKEELISNTYQWVEKETKQLSTLSVVAPGSIGTIAFNSYGFGNHKVVINALATTGDAILVGAQLRTNDLIVSVRTSADQSVWSTWENVAITKTMQDESYLITGQTATNYSNVRYVQGKVELFASDSSSSPEIERVELRSEDSGLYDYDGEYTVQLDMTVVAADIGKTFKRIDFIKWIEPQQPAGTQMFIRSSSSLDNIFWGPISAPYSKSPRRIRLKKGNTSHNLVLGPIDEGAKFNFSKTVEMVSWDTQAYFPKDPNGTSTRIIFSKTKTNQESVENELTTIDDPNMENKTLSFAPQPYFITVEMTRPSAGATPVMDRLNIDQNIQYTEAPHIIGEDISAVDSLGTGIKSLRKINDYAFSYPNTAGHITFNQDSINKSPLTYILQDETKRPTDVILYFKSEENEGSKTNLSLSATDEIIGKVLKRRLEFGDKTGVITHLQTAQGKVQYLRPYDREIDADFTPSLFDSKKYRYYLYNGWPDDVHITVEEQTLEDIAVMHDTSVEDITDINSDILVNEDNTLVKNQSIFIPNNTVNAKVSLLFQNGTVYTMKSGHNSRYDQTNGQTVTDFSSEKYAITVTDAPPKGFTPWTSEEKIYIGVINFNDIRDGFIRTQYNASTNSAFNRSYTVASGDTWESIALKFNLAKVLNDEPNIIDLQFANPGIETLEAGQVLTIPSNIILPNLAPEAEFDSSNPYEISIIPDSVQKKDGTRIDESFIPIDWNSKHSPMVPTYRDSIVYTAVLTRGDSPNGMDPLPLSHVKQIVSIVKNGSGITYHEWNGAFGDFKLTSNYVDWSPNESGSIEPAAGEKYTVNYIREEIDTVKIHLDTDYFERLGGDIVWRSSEVKVYDGICTPKEDFEMLLPAASSFEGYSPIYQNIGYVVEDNDLWVETKIETRGNDMYLIGTLNGKDPSKNWHPTVKTGYYYLKEQEFYLYSEPMKTVLNEKELPTVEGIEYVKGPTGIGALLLPSGQNLAKDTAFASTNWKPAKVFTANSVA